MILDGKVYITIDDAVELIDEYLVNSPLDEYTPEQILWEVQSKLKEYKELELEDEVK